MKITKLFYVAPAVLLAAGCASHHQTQSQAKFDDSLYPGYAAGGSGGADGRTSGSTQSSTTASVPFYSSDIFSTNPADNSVVSQIRQSIQKDDRLASVAPTIHIGANKGVVTLMGNVNDEQQKKNVEDMARQAAGVVSVDNRIEISSQTASMIGADSGMNETFSPTSRTNTSNRIYHEVGKNEQSGLDSTNSLYTSADSLSASNQFDSSSDQLSPTSTRLDQSSSVYSGDTNSATSTQSGQTGSVNVMVQGNSQSDRTLAQQVSQELRANGSLSSALSQVSISVDDGRITLHGSVKSEEQKRQIESAIQRVTGVSSVDNQLQVGSDQSSPMNP